MFYPPLIKIIGLPGMRTTVLGPLSEFISTSVEGTRAVYAADMDNDGDIDVLSGEYDGGALNIDKIILFENNGSQDFTQRDIVTNTNQVRSTIAADMDNDGAMDILLVSQYNGISWYENNTHYGPVYHVSTSGSILILVHLHHLLQLSRKESMLQVMVILFWLQLAPILRISTSMGRIL